MTSSKKKILLISSLSIVTVLIIGVFAVYQVKNVKTSNNLQEVNTSSAKAFNDVKILEEVLSEENTLNQEGTALSDTDKEFLKSLGFTESELTNFRLYTTNDLLNSNVLSDTYKTQFSNVYADEEYYIDTVNKTIILKNSRMVENTDVVALGVDNKYKVLESNKENVKETNVTYNGEEKTYVNVYVRPKNDDVAVTNKNEQTNLQTIGEVNYSDYTGYPKFYITKETNIKYIVTLTKHEDMTNLQYKLGNSGNWLNYTEPFALYQNTTIYTRYAVVENPTEDDYKNGNMKTVSELKLLQTEVEVVNIEGKTEYEGYKAVIKFKLNENETKFIEDNFPGASLAVKCEVAFVSEDEEDMIPDDEEYESADSSKLVEKENNELKFKAEKAGTYYLKLKTTITTDSKDPIYIAESKERVVTIKTKNEENKNENTEKEPEDVPETEKPEQDPEDSNVVENEENVDLEDPLYSTELSNIEIKILNTESKELEKSKATFTIEGEENPISTLEELVSMINLQDDEITINVEVPSDCNSFEIIATATEPEKTIINGNGIGMTIVNGKIQIPLTIKSGDKTKKILFNINKKMPTKIDDVQAISLVTIPNASHSFGATYLEREKERFDLTDENYIDSLIDYIRNTENPTVYVRVESGCEKLTIYLDSTKYELNVNEAEKIDETKLAEVTKLTGENYELKAIEKEIKVTNNGKEYSVKFVVYKYVKKVDNSGNIYFEKEDNTIQIIKGKESENIKIELKDTTIDTSKLEIKEVEKYTVNKETEKIVTLGEITTKTEEITGENEEKVTKTYLELPVTGENYGKVKLELTHNEDKTIRSNLTILVVPELKTSNVEIKAGATGNISYEVEGIEEISKAYASKDESIATVDAEGKVTGIAAGETQVELSVIGKMNLYKVVEDKPVEATEIEEETNEVINTVENEVTNTVGKTETSIEETDEKVETITLVGNVSVKVNRRCSSNRNKIK